VIRTFRDDETAAVFARAPSRRLPVDLQRRAYRKLVLIHAATRLEELLVPRGNRLERLRGDRAGQYSIRINDQWRICFRWHDGDAYDVEVCDYH
jgi:proteic killer suppression protein